eukprot:4600859-Ditylum_brightwellii.AAC.1
MAVFLWLGRAGPVGAQDDRLICEQRVFGLALRTVSVDWGCEEQYVSLRQNVLAGRDWIQRMD